MADRIMDMIDSWEERFFPKGGGGEGALVELCVQVGRSRIEILNSSQCFVRVSFTLRPVLLESQQLGRKCLRNTQIKVDRMCAEILHPFRVK